MSFSCVLGRTQPSAHDEMLAERQLVCVSVEIVIFSLGFMYFGATRSRCILEALRLDKRLSWNASQWEGIKQIYIPHQKIWRPDITLVNKYVSIRVQTST